MAKGEKLLGTVRANRRSYGPGQEKEFFEYAESEDSEVDLDQLREDGLIGEPEEGVDPKTMRQGATTQQREAERAGAKETIQRRGDRPAAKAAAKQAKAGSGGSDEGDEGEGEDLPTVNELADHLDGIDSADEIRAMQKRDTRTTAQPIYENRLAQLEEQQ